MELDNDVIMSQTKHNSVVDMKHWWAAETLNGLLWGISSKPLTTPLARMAARHHVPNWLQPLVQTAHCGWLLHKYGSPPHRRAAGDGRNICRSRWRAALCQRPWLTMPQHFRCGVWGGFSRHSGCFALGCVTWDSVRRRLNVTFLLRPSVTNRLPHKT